MKWSVEVRVTYTAVLEVEAPDQTTARKRARRLDGHELTRTAAKVVVPDVACPRPRAEEPPGPYDRDDDEQGAEDVLRKAVGR